MSSIYSSGTIAINNGSYTVSGTGTLFISVAGVRAGDLLTLDGLAFFEIYQVNSNTELLIRTIPSKAAYAGINVSGVNYAILRNFTSSTGAEVAAKVLEIQRKWQNREEEITGWMASNSVSFDVTDLDGNTVSIVTPTEINRIAQSIDEAAISVDNTIGRVDAAEITFSNIEGTLDQKVTDAQNAKSDAENASNSITTTHLPAAISAKEAAEQAETNAASTENNIQTVLLPQTTDAKDAAEIAESNIVNTHLPAALSAVDLASNWASAPEGQVVGSGLYSALHYAAKAEEFKNQA